MFSKNLSERQIHFTSVTWRNTTFAARADTKAASSNLAFCERKLAKLKLHPNAHVWVLQACLSEKTRRRCCACQHEKNETVRSLRPWKEMTKRFILTNWNVNWRVTLNPFFLWRSDPFWWRSQGIWRVWRVLFEKWTTQRKNRVHWQLIVDFFHAKSCTARPPSFAHCIGAGEDKYLANRNSFWHIPPCKRYLHKSRRKLKEDKSLQKSWPLCLGVKNHCNTH